MEVLLCDECETGYNVMVGRTQSEETWLRGRWRVLVRKREVTGDLRRVKAHEEGCREAGEERGGEEGRKEQIVLGKALVCNVRLL